MDVLLGSFEKKLEKISLFHALKYFFEAGWSLIPERHGEFPSRDENIYITSPNDRNNKHHQKYYAKILYLPKLLKFPVTARGYAKNK